MLEWLGDAGPIIIATVAIIIAIWQSHSRTHDKIEAQFDKVDNRFEKVDSRFEKVDNRFDNLENKIDARFDKVEGRLSHLEQDMSEMKGMLKVFINGKHTN